MTTNAAELRNEVEAAKYLDCSHRTLQKKRGVGGGPKYLKIGRLVKYRQSDLDAFLVACERENTSQAR